MTPKDRAPLPPPVGPPAGDGLLIIDKPAGWTSHDVVGRLRRLCQTRKVGHAGTLDPMATGVLVVGVNRATKLLTFLVGCDKTYLATIRLGADTVTDDAEGDITQTFDATGLDIAAIDAGLRDLTGAIEQVPSSVSAIKVNGQRSYARVRSGEDVQLAARPVTVHSLMRLGEPRREGTFVDIDVEVEVSSGTYIRALARDLGAALGVGGHLSALQRTKVGDFSLEQAHSLEQLADEGAAAQVLPLQDAATAAFPVRQLSESETTKLGYGQRIESGAARGPVVAAIAPDGSLAALLDESGNKVATHVVFAAR